MSQNPKILAVENYIQGLCESNLDKILSLYADDATVEDPVGTEPRKGMAAITEFYNMAISSKITAKLEGPVRIAGPHALFPFSITMDFGESTMNIDVIDQFTFNDDNKIISMKAFWGEENSRMS
ncbi:nuclear transport factor 2 family protein [Spongiibacter sp. KMU-158]|uniref:Nuclear transport factor 2 family protein n=1 Tax=Spongiibacter pelagi TaxID=2760804 RepID=A0A927GWB3_9GAMM|nr:nuclear transport factor 2 family protein [Spongiibacter pelagi]MBD2859265.1 nuclear transport factor 2 family protein [Spongiibacter pelagi]